MFLPISNFQMSFLSLTSYSILDVLQTKYGCKRIFVFIALKPGAKMNEFGVQTSSGRALNFYMKHPKIKLQELPQIVYCYGAHKLGYIISSEKMYKLVTQLQKPFRWYEHLKYYMDKVNKANFRRAFLTLTHPKFKKIKERKNFRKSILNSELAFFKCDFWTSYLVLNPFFPYQCYSPFWFYQLPIQFLYNNLLDYSSLDYLFIIWTYANSNIKFLQKKKFFNKKPCLIKLFEPNYKKPHPILSPFFRLIKIINEGFGFGLNPFRDPLKSYYYRYLETFKRWQREQEKVAYKDTRVRTYEILEETQKIFFIEEDKKKRKGRWIEEKHQLITIENYDRRVQLLWNRFHSRLLFYRR